MVEPLVCTAAAMASSLTPASAASRICIRLSRRAKFVSFGLAEVDPIPYVHSQSPSWGRALGESTMNQLLDRETTAATAQFTAEQG